MPFGARIIAAAWKDTLVPLTEAQAVLPERRASEPVSSPASDEAAKPIPEAPMMGRGRQGGGMEDGNGNAGFGNRNSCCCLGHYRSG